MPTKRTKSRSRTPEKRKEEVQEPEPEVQIPKACCESKCFSIGHEKIIISSIFSGLVILLSLLLKFLV